MRNKTIITFLASKILLVVTLYFTSSVIAKDLPGAAQTSYGVNNSGGFNFNMPLVIPQGTNGMQPNISLNFSSNGGNGLLGVGGNISGLGAITRCASTIATDGIKGKVSHDRDDKFCLNGQRLILVSGTYGAANSEYRTEIDSISRITAYGSSNNLNDSQSAPNWWEVRTRDNEIWRYGLATSKFYLPGTNSIHQWKLSQKRDFSLNFYEVFYHADNGRPDRIEYTANTTRGLAADKTITFSYQNRGGSENRPRYVLGKSIPNHKRLRSIQVRKGGGKIREYIIAYENSGKSQRSRVTSITECGIADECMPPVMVDWQAEASGFDNTSAVGSIAPHEMFRNDLIKVYRNNRWELTKQEVNHGAWVDINGDGQTDQILSVVMPGNAHTPSNSTLKKAYLKNEDGDDWNETSSYRLPKPLRNYDMSTLNRSGRFVSNVVNQGQLVDVNGDGLVDVVYGYRHFSDNLQSNSSPVTQFKGVYLNTGNGISTTVSAAYVPKDYLYDYTKNGAGNVRMETQTSRLIDVNGDGLVDWVQAYHVYQSGGAGVKHTKTWLNNGNGWNANPTEGYALPNTFAEYVSSNVPLSHGEFVDVNGDGLVDWMESFHRSQGSLVSKAWINTGSGWEPDEAYKLPEAIYENTSGWSASLTVKRGSFIDVNGDGLRDWVRSYQKSSTGIYKAVRLNTGSGWAAVNAGFSAPPFIHQDSTYSNENRHWPTQSRGFYLDLNKDGLVDYTEGYKDINNTTRLNSWINNGSGWVKNNSYNPGFTFVDYSDRDEGVVRYGNFMDIDSDGGADWVSASNVVLGTKLNRLARVDRIKTITTTMGVEVKPTFLPLTDNKDLYTKGTGAAEADSYHMAGAMYVTSKLQVSRADGSGYNTTAYSYHGAQINRLGRGFLGFKRRWAEQLQKRITDYKQFYQNYPFVGRTQVNEVSRYVTSTGVDRLLSRALIAYDARPITHANGAQTKFVHTRWSTHKSYELNDGKQYRHVSRVKQYDDYGNQTYNSVTTGVTDADTTKQGQTVTYNTYKAPDLAKWYVSQLEKTVISDRAPGQANKNRRTDYTYDWLSRLKTMIREPNSGQALKLTTTYYYDIHGNIRQERVTSGDTSLAYRYTNIEYDAQYRLPTKVTNSLGHESTIAYQTWCDTPLRSTDANGVVTTFTYDNFCRETQATTAGIWSTTAYKTTLPCTTCQVAAPLTVEKQNKGELKIFTFFNKHGQPQVSRTQSMTGAWIEQRTEYDKYARIERQSQPFFVSTESPQWTTYQYDVLDREYNMTLPFSNNGANAIVKHRYSVTDDGHQLVNKYDTLNNRTRYYTNALGQMVEILDAKNGLLQYSYDAQGNLIQTKDANNNTIDVSYDVLGRRTQLDDPDMGVSNYAYNAFNETVWQKDAKNQVITMDYDRLGRMVERTVPGTQSAGTSTWAYDTATNGKGLLASVTDQNGYSESYTYDSLTRLKTTTTVIKGKTFNQSLTYNSNGFLASRRYPNSGSGQAMLVNYSYTNGYLSLINSDSGPGNTTEHWRANKYDALGRITEDTLGNVVTTARTFNPAQGVLERIESNLLSNGTVVQDLNYTYDVMNNVKSRVDGIASTNETFSYDQLDRLTQYTKNGTVKTVAYDAIGNITYKSDVGGYHYDGDGGPHALSKVTLPLGTDPLAEFNIKFEFSNYGVDRKVPTDPTAHADYQIHGKNFTYDDNGNITDSGNRKVYWTSFDKPHTIVAEQYSGKNFGSIMEYGPNFERVYKQETQFGNVGQVVAIKDRTIYVGKDYEHITDKNGTVKHRYTIDTGGGTVSIERADGSSVNESSYMLTDALGSTNVVIDDNGDVAQTLAFDPWGMRTNTGDVTLVNSITNKGYTGHEMDDESGLINMNARIYDPYLGVFLSADTMVPDAYDMRQYNRYAYVMGNPLKYTDPTGHEAVGFFITLISSFVNGEEHTSGDGDIKTGCAEGRLPNRVCFALGTDQLEGEPPVSDDVPQDGSQGTGSDDVPDEAEMSDFGVTVLEDRKDYERRRNGEFKPPSSFSDCTFGSGACGGGDFLSFDNNRSVFDNFGRHLPSLPQGLVDFSAGFGDSLSFNLTKHFRDLVGIHGVDTDSTIYFYGNTSGTAFGLFNAGRAGLQVYRGINRAKKWRTNSVTSRRTRARRIAAAGSYRTSAGDAILTLTGGAGVNSYVSLITDNI